MTTSAEAKAYNWDTVRREDVTELFTRQLVWGEKVMLARLELKTGCVVPQHSHENEQVSMVTSGVIRFWLGEQREQRDLRAGDVLVIPAHVLHEAEVLEDFTGIDVFTPPRQDWLDGTDAYLRR